MESCRLVSSSKKCTPRMKVDKVIANLELCTPRTNAQAIFYLGGITRPSEISPIYLLPINKNDIYGKYFQIMIIVVMFVRVWNYDSMTIHVRFPKLV